MKGYKLNLHLFYLNKGLGLLNYAKYCVAFFGLTTQDPKWTAIIAVLFGISCYILGRWWVWSKYAEAEIEVQNRINLFVGEVRNKLDGGLKMPCGKKKKK